MAEINVTPVRGRDAGAADRLHGDGAAAHRRRAGRPAADARARDGPDLEPLAVTIDSEGKVFLQNTPIALDRARAKLKAISANGYDQRIFVRGDQTVGYGKVMEVMGLLNTAGFTRIGLVTQSQRPAAGR